MMHEQPLHSFLVSHPDEEIRQATIYAENYMSSPKFDSSHDFSHVLRVVALALKILHQTELKGDPGQFVARFDPKVVVLGALLHDIEDRKYSDSAPPQSVHDLVLTWSKGNSGLARTIQDLVAGVSYSSEVKEPGRVHQLILMIPELAIVQDADRLDAIGAIGIGRCFAFGAARGRPMEDGLLHFEEKLLKVEGMMKTEQGRIMAENRTRRIEEFISWWRKETLLLNESCTYTNGMSVNTTQPKAGPTLTLPSRAPDKI